jgi:hypothetical protein
MESVYHKRCNLIKSYDQLTKKFIYMKYLVFIATLVVTASCTDEETVYSVTPELSQYVDGFYQAGADRGKVLPKTNLSAYLDSQCNSITVVEKDGDQWILKFDKEIFAEMEAQGNPNNKIEALIFHELGRIVLKREIIHTTFQHDPNPSSIMNPYYKVEGYGASQRAALLDELFK